MEYEFRLREQHHGTDKAWDAPAGGADRVVVPAEDILDFGSKGDGGLAGRLPGLLFAQERYRDLEMDNLAGLELSALQRDLALDYGFCSPEASLLMLYSVEQFEENQLAVPQGHPAHSACTAKMVLV